MKCFSAGEKRRNFHCKIILLDDTEFIQEIQDTSRGQDLIDVVFKHLNLLETAYFGLRFIDGSGQTRWLDANKNIIKQLKGLTPINLYFGVKFYASDPCKLLEEITRYQFFLQVKQDILQSRLPVSFDLAAELLAYAVQSELGDYDSRRHQNGYISEFRFLPNQPAEMEKKVAELHKALAGQVPATAEINFLERIKWLDLYGADLHPVLGEDNVEYFLGLTPSGIIVLRSKTKVGNYFWPRVVKIYRKGKYFMIRVLDKSNEENTYGFELPNKAACKHLWKCCNDHQNFFKLTQNNNTLPSSTKFGLSQRFRGSFSARGSILKSQPSLTKDNFRDRPPPNVVRVPSRRYQRRLGQPDGADANTTKDEAFKENGYIEVKSSIIVPSSRHDLKPIQRSLSIPNQLPLSEPTTRSVPWPMPHERGLFSSSTNPSPRSTRSAALSSSRNRRTLSEGSEAEYNFYSRRNSSSSNVHHKSGLASDNESEVSKHSRSSRHSRRSNRSSTSHRHCRHRKNADESGTESDSSRKHRRRHKHLNANEYKLVDSEPQWKEVQRQKLEKSATASSYTLPRPSFAHNAAVRHVSGYVNSGLESDTEKYDDSTLNRVKRRQKLKTKSPETARREPLASEVKRHIEYQLVDPVTLSENEKRDIKYTKIETDSRLFKIRYDGGRNRYTLKNVDAARQSNNLNIPVMPSTDVNGKLTEPPQHMYRQDSSSSHASLSSNSINRAAGSESSGQGLQSMHIIQKVSFMPERNDYMVQRPAPSLLFNSHGNSNGNQFLNHTKNSNIKDLNGYTDRLIGKEFNTSTHDQSRQLNGHTNYSNGHGNHLNNYNNHNPTRVTFQTPPSTTAYYTNGDQKLVANGNKTALVSHEMSTEL